MFRNLSYSHKIPLRGSLLIVVTAVFVTASLMYGIYRDLKQDALQNAGRMSRILSYTLKPLLLNDDARRAFEVINFQHAEKIKDIKEILVLNTRQQVYVSSQPELYPPLSNIASIDPGLSGLKSMAATYLEGDPRTVETSESGKFYMLTPITSDGALLGTLVVGYSSSMFLPHFYDIVRRSVITTLIVSAILLPLSWFWGRRMAIPLTQLSGSMAKVGASLPNPDEFDLYQSEDEIGQMGVAFKRMLRDLKEKENMEKQVLVSERLAAVGRLSAGIAHEINNPLGGMLNAISTAKKHANSDPQTQKTISLLERGLLQIKNTISALLVEAKFQSHPLTVQDIEDTRILVLANAHNASARLTWENEITETLQLPSTPVRQVFINLLLNAIQACEGQVYCHIFLSGNNLMLTVRNDGKHISTEQMSYLFEPFSSGREGGHGLGLWMTYQIVAQLGGVIGMQSQPGETEFTVTLPMGDAA
jgi:signal transduction histidine kinase